MIEVAIVGRCVQLIGLVSVRGGECDKASRPQGKLEDLTDNAGLAKPICLSQFACIPGKGTG